MKMMSHKVFSIWIGEKPSRIPFECMAENNLCHDFTLIAEENWVNAKTFIPISSVISEMLKDYRCYYLWNSFKHPRERSDLLRLFYLMKNPDFTYADSDCVVHSLPVNRSDIAVPSSQKDIEKIYSQIGHEPDMDDVVNSTGQYVEVYLISGNGDSQFFDDWIGRYFKKWNRPGGIAESIIYEKVNLQIIPEASYTHYSKGRLLLKNQM